MEGCAFGRDQRVEVQEARPLARIQERQESEQGHPGRRPCTSRDQQDEHHRNAHNGPATPCSRHTRLYVKLNHKRVHHY